MKNLLERIPSIFRNFYFLSILFFIVWLSFIDSNDLFFQTRLSVKKTELEKSRNFYLDKIMEIKNDHAALNTNPYLLEKIAREKYLMKKDNEDLFIVIKNPQ